MNAQISTKRAFLNSEFGMMLACKKLNVTEAKIEEIVGRYTKGKYKGQLRGVLQWWKVEKGGWVRTGAYDHDTRQGQGFVCPFKLSFGYQIKDAWDDEKLHLPNYELDRTSELESAISATIKYLKEKKEIEK